MSSTTYDPNKPVTGYPTTANYPPPPPPQPYYHQHHQTGYPSAQTSYAYTAPPPPATYYNPNPYPQPTYDPQRATFLRRIIIVGISVFLIISVISFISWIVIRPQLPEFRVDSALVSNFNVSSLQLSANWEIGFFVRNPNKKMTIFYDRIEGSVFYKDEFLTETTLAPFYQNEKNETAITTKFTASGTYIGDQTVKDLVGDRNKGGVNFHVKMLAWVRFRSGAWRTGRRLMRVFCKDVNIGFSPNTASTGSLSASSKECQVDL